MEASILDRPLADTLFAWERPHFGPAACREAQAALRRVVEALRKRRATATTPRGQALAVGRVLFGRFAFQFQAGPRGEDFPLTSVLLRRRGNCLGLTSLYAAAAEQLDLPFRPRLFEAHIAVCHVGTDPPLHVETSRGGAILRERLVNRLYYAAPGKRQILSKRQFLAVHLSNQAAHILARDARFVEAVAKLDQAVALFPAYAAAWINRAAVLARLGRLDEAAQSVRAALGLEPGKQYQSALERITGSLVASSGCTATQMRETTSGNPNQAC